MKTILGLACLVAACVQFWIGVKVLQAMKITGAAARRQRMAAELQKASPIAQLIALPLYGRS